MNIYLLDLHSIHILKLLENNTTSMNECDFWSPFEAPCKFLEEDLTGGDSVKIGTGMNESRKIKKLNMTKSGSDISGQILHTDQ